MSAVEVEVDLSPGADAELAKLLAEAKAASPAATGMDTDKPLASGSRERGAIQKVAYNHQAMIDLILANPAISQNEIARHFGLTPAWVSQVMVSDAFQTAFAKRREEMIDPVLQRTVEDNFKALVSRSLDVLLQKLNRPAIAISDNLALRAAEIGARAAGYGAKETALPGGTPVEVNIHLEQLGGGLVQLLQRKKREAEAVTVVESLAESKPDTALAIALTQE